MNIFERQNAIMNRLFRERHTTAEVLSAEFGVSERTIRDDIIAMSCKLPIKSVRGRYNGGIWLEDWFEPDAGTLSFKQEDLLKRLKLPLMGEDLIIMNSILIQFAPSKGYWEADW